MPIDFSHPIEIAFGPIRGAIYGGPFKLFSPTRRMVSVNMAAEIRLPSDMHVPTRDFSIPEYEKMVRALIFAIQSMKDGHDVYVGCMGGVGRTGLFIGCMVKVWSDFRAMFPQHAHLIPEEVVDPVAFTRAHYKRHAIETSEQMDFVASFDSAPVLSAISEMIYVPVEPQSALEAFCMGFRLLFSKR